MKILVIADEVSKAYYDYFDKALLEDIDLILSCGDLPPEYLSFLVTFAHCPLLYVRGNHDVKYEKRPPEGCICIDDDIYPSKSDSKCRQYLEYTGKCFLCVIHILELSAVTKKKSFLVDRAYSDNCNWSFE